MNHTFKKAMTSAVAVATIGWSVGLSSLVAPLAANAAVTAGTLVKASLPAVYYVGTDMKRYVFPNEKTYKTWYSDFSGVMTITDAELASLAIGGNVTYKPGVMMVKITTDPKVYVVDAHGVLRWVKTEAAASGLYGSNWNQQIHDVPDAFFTNYTTGSDVSSASDFNRSSISSAATSINVDKNLGPSTTVSGSLSAMLSSGQPAGGTVPKGANGVSAVKVDVKNAGSSSSTVDSVTVHRAGPGATSDISNVYVYAGNDRLTTGRTVNSSTNDSVFSGLNLSLGAGETKTIWIGIDWSSTAASANVHSFSITSIQSGTSVASGLPVSGPSFTISGALAGEVEIDDSGTISNPKAGQMGAKVASFKLDVSSQEDIQLSRIALHQNGTIDRDQLTNLSLKQAGLTLSTVSSLNSKDLAVYALSSPMLNEKGSSKTFEVYADISGATDANESIAFELEETTDLLAVGNTFGYGVQVVDSYAGSSSSVIAGQITLNFNGPAAHDLATNGKDVELYNFSLSSAANVEVRHLRMAISTVGGDAGVDANDLINGTSANITDIKVVDTASGATIAGPRDVSTSGDDVTQSFDFNETFNVNAGQTRTFKVTADVANNVALASDQIRVDLLQFLGTDIRNLDNSSNVAIADIVPNSTLAGNANTIKTSSLTIGQASTPVQQTYIQGTQNALLAGFTLKAGDAAPVKVSSLMVTGYIDVDGDANSSVGSQGCDFGGCANTVAATTQTIKLWNGSTQIGDTESPTNSSTVGAGGVATFDNLNLTIPAGQTITLTVSGNIAGSVQNLPVDVYFGIAASGDVSATDVDGNSITVSGSVAGSNRQMKITSAGTVTVALAPDDTESEAGLVVGGATNAVLAKFKVSATNEELKMSKAHLAVDSGSANGVSMLSIYDGSTLVGSSSVDGNGDAFFTNLSGFVVPKDGTKTFVVKGTLNSVGNSGALSGTDLMVTFMDDADTEFRGTSAGSSTTITGIPAGDIDGRSKLVYKSKPTITLVSLPTSTVTTGNTVVNRFTVSADAAGDVAFQDLVVTSTADACLGSSGLRRVGDGTDLAGACSGTGPFTIHLTNEEVVAAGTSRTYDVRLDVTGTPPSVSSSIGATGFHWSDISVTPHDSTGETSTDWETTGALIRTLPTDQQTLTD